MEKEEETTLRRTKNEGVPGEPGKKGRKKYEEQSKKTEERRNKNEQAGKDEDSVGRRVRILVAHASRVSYTLRDDISRKGNPSLQRDNLGPIYLCAYRLIRLVRNTFNSSILFLPKLHSSPVQ